jgi:beta-carotene 3-hydroxylase
MELLSYVLHRFIFHGLLWKIHQTHHHANHSVFELNDLFSAGFAILAISLLYTGAPTMISTPWFGIGAGITLYGLLYFWIHDVYTHKRFIRFSTRNRIMRKVKIAHQQHHQTIEKQGNEPYGLFLFPYHKYKSKKDV